MNALFLLLSLLAPGTVAAFTRNSRDSEESDVGKTKERGLSKTKDDVVNVEPQTKKTPDTVNEVTDTNTKAPAVVNEKPTAPEQTGDGPDVADPGPKALSSKVEVMAGRVTTLSAEDDDITSLRIVDGPAEGSLTVNPDNTLALVMTLSDYTGTQNITYEATHADGSTSLHQVELDVVPGLQEDGWSTGAAHYMLATDEDDRVIFEEGEDYRAVYVTAGSHGLSLAEIAEAEGMDVAQVTGSWLAEHGGYGASEDMALAEDAGLALWHELTPRGTKASLSLLLERGEEYALGERFLDRQVNGEDELHPLHFGAWGEGERPVITELGRVYQEGSDNILFQDWSFEGGFWIVNSSNFMFDNVQFTGQTGLIVNQCEGVTVRNSEFVDIFREGTPEAFDGRTHGIYVNETDGLLLEGLFVDHNGWADSYVDGTGQAPSMWSQNLYLNWSNDDVTLRDSISMRASSFGVQVRSGGFIENNLFLDNNAGVEFLGGDYKGAGPNGYYTYFGDNVTTSGAHKIAVNIGALTLGVSDEALMSTLSGNIVTHLADPNNPEEIAFKEITHDGLRTNETVYYDDTMVWNWVGSRKLWNPENVTMEQNVEGLDPEALDQTTIQLFAAQLLGKPDASISDLADYLRAQYMGEMDEVVDVDLINDFFREGFGLDTTLRTEADTLRFIPDDLADGVRWDNRLNWSTEDLPGTVAGDSVDLGGNHVIFNAHADIDTLDLGDGGQLDIHGGKLATANAMTASGGDASLTVQGAGQVWIAGSEDGSLDIDIASGRFVNTGDMSHTDLAITDGEAVLATGGGEFDVSAGHRLAILDGGAKVGFDGDDGGIAILDLHEDATIAFGAASGTLGRISEFRTGAMGDETDVLSGIDLGGATLEIDLDGLNAAAGNTFTLMDADELTGLIDEATLAIGGLGARNATIVVDYEADAVRLELTAGTGQVSVQTRGAESDVEAGEDALWAALTEDHGVIAENAAYPNEEDEALDVAA